MYKALLFIGLLFCMLSCSTDCVDEDKVITKNIIFDSQDNVIKVDEGQWLSNSNYDYNNWVYNQEYGVKWVDGLLYLHYDKTKYDIVSAEFYNFPYHHTSSIDVNGDFYLESKHFPSYINDTDVFYIKLKLKEK